MGWEHVGLVAEMPLAARYCAGMCNLLILCLQSSGGSLFHCVGAVTVCTATGPRSAHVPVGENGNC